MQGLDVVLLCDLFLDFRRLCLKHFELCPVNFITLPALAFSAALKRTDIQLELITDPTLYAFVESEIRGGVSFVGNREAIGNYPHRADFRPNEPIRYIKYMDMNNL